MTAKEKLILFMEAKSDLIKKQKVTRLQYFTKADRKEIEEEWPEWTCQEVWVYIAAKSRNLEVSGLDAHSCPWCLNYDFGCRRGCKYRQRNGCCCDISSKYGAIIDSIGEETIGDIFSLRYYKQLVDEINKQGDKDASI